MFQRGGRKNAQQESFAIRWRAALGVPRFKPVLEVQEIRLDPDSRRTWCGPDEIVLSRKEFDLVHALISRAGDIVTRDDLMRDVWHTTFWTSSKTIDVHLGWVRRKLKDDSRCPHLITTIRGEGLRFEKGQPTLPGPGH